MTEGDFRNLLSSSDFNDAIKPLAKKTTRDLFAKYGAICLSTCSSNIPLWGHYANNHYGYCLIFEVDFEKIGELTNLPEKSCGTYKDLLVNGEEMLTFYKGPFYFVFAKVKYENNPCEIDLSKLMHIENPYNRTKYLVEKSIGVKYKQWEYENEFRLVVTQNSNDGDGTLDLRDFAPFLKITGVVIGHKLNSNEEELFKDLCLKHQLDLYRAIKCQMKSIKLKNLK